MTKRKQHKPEFKARVALEALKGKQTAAELIDNADAGATDDLTPEKVQEMLDNELARRDEQARSGAAHSQFRARFRPITIDASSAGKQFGLC